MKALCNKWIPPDDLSAVLGGTLKIHTSRHFSYVTLNSSQMQLQRIKYNKTSLFDELIP